MTMSRLLSLLFAVIAFAAVPALAQEKPLSTLDRKAIEGIVRDYILNNPEVVIQTIQNLRDRDEKAAKDKIEANLVKFLPDRLNDPASPVGANLNGDVTIIEFFDYRCGFCKRVFPDIIKVLNEDRNIRYVFKEFPILGPESVFAAKAALAVWLIDDGKYSPFHKALMKTKGALPESRVLRIAAGIGLDVKALKKAMGDGRVDGMIEKNFALAEALDINGTPAFIIGDQVIRGAIDLASLKELISKARGS